MFFNRIAAYLCRRRLSGEDRRYSDRRRESLPQRLDQRLQLFQPTDPGRQVLDLEDRRYHISGLRGYNAIGAHARAYAGNHLAGLLATTFPTLHRPLDEIE